MFEVSVPSTREEMRTTFREQEAEITTYLEEFSDEAFFAPQGEHWSPAGHTQHLVKTLRAVVRGLGQSRLALLVLGRSRRGSRSYDEVVAQYRDALAQGADAGPYGPSDRVPDMPRDEWRRQIMERWATASRELRKGVLRWHEPQLDRYRLPHPLIGKLTLRELLLWTLYHNAHHARRIAERAGDRT